MQAVDTQTIIRRGNVVPRLIKNVTVLCIYRDNFGVVGGGKSEQITLYLTSLLIAGK